MLDEAHQFIRFLDEIARVRGRTTAAFRDLRVGTGLSDVEIVVLTAVAGSERPPTVPQIGRSLGHPRQVIQRAADALVARGLIAWRDNPDHKRARLLAPTEAGERMARANDRAGLERARHLVATLDPALLEDTVHGLRTIRAAIEANLRTIAETADADEQEDA